MVAVYEITDDENSAWGEEPASPVSDAAEDRDGWTLPVSDLVFDWTYYGGKHGLTFGNCFEAYQHFTEQGMFSKLDPSLLVSCEFVLYWGHLNGQPIHTAEDFFGRLQSLPADSEIGWSPRMVPKWILLQLPEAPGAGERLLDILGQDLPAAGLSAHPGLALSAPANGEKTVAGFLSRQDDEFIRGASLVDLAKYVSQHKDLAKAGLTASAIFDHVWCYGLRQNRLSYLGNKAPRKMNHLQLLRTALSVVFAKTFEGRTIEKDLPRTRLPSGNVVFLESANGELESILRYDPANESEPPPLEHFHEVISKLGGGKLVVFGTLHRPQPPGPAIHGAAPLLDTDLLRGLRSHPSRRVVYSINLGLYDEMPVPPELDDCDYYMVTDARTMPSNLPWRIVRPTLTERDRKRLCLWYKTHPHILFPDAQHALWIDGNLDCLSGSEKVVAAHETLSEVATFQHPDRDCVYEEAKAVDALALDLPQKVKAIVDKMKAAGLPQNYGLFETNVLYSKPGDYRVRAFFDRWWREIFLGSRRDQMSFTFAAFMTGIEITRLDNNRCAKDSRFFRKRAHRDMKERTV
jgi:hypothetical protein